MVNLDWRVESRTGVSLVTLVVENPSRTPRRVRVANRLDGPVGPPRREGVPEAGWDDGGFEGVVAAGESRPLGYASLAPPDEPPVELVWTERAGATERDSGQDAVEKANLEGEKADLEMEGASPEGVVRSLGDARPPADAVPTPGPARDTTPLDGSATPARDPDSDVPDLGDADADRRRSP